MFAFKKKKKFKNIDGVWWRASGSRVSVCIGGMVKGEIEV